MNLRGAYNRLMMRRYRLRTWLRGHSPYVLSDRIPKGRADCGDHDWYRADAANDRCYHCLVGVRPHSGPVPGEDAVTTAQVREHLRAAGHRAANA